MHIGVIQLQFSACDMSLPAMSLQLAAWDLGSAPAERVGEGEVGGFQPWAQVTWLLLGLAVESPWPSPGGPFLSSYARTGLENGLLAM